MLPATLRYWLFDTLSVQPMRYVSAIPTRKAEGLTKKVYDMIREDFFKNGSLTSRSKVPELMAAIWVGGRETMLVEDKVDRTTKDAFTAVMSQINECPYCEDMLISLVYAGGEPEAANAIMNKSGFDISDPILRSRLEWIQALATGCKEDIPDTPFTPEQMPEVIGTIMGMSDINRYSHVVMAESAVSAPFGLDTIKGLMLRMFGTELKVTRRVPLQPGKSLSLLPAAELPEDMDWAKANPRIADAVSRWAAAVELESTKVINHRVRETVYESLSRWDGLPMPMDSSWIQEETRDLSGEDEIIARFAIIIAKASYRVTPELVYEVMGKNWDEERFIRILAWASFSGARRFVRVIADKYEAQQKEIFKLAA